MSFGNGRFDAVIAGGGVYGILLALEGAARGQRVLLLERKDYGCGASSNHLRTIHGGLRYLQSLDVHRAALSNRERLWWLRTFPDLIHPITCLMPLYGEGLRRAEAFRAAFLLASSLGLDKGVDGRIRPMRIVPTGEVRRLLPWCRHAGLDRGALWQDAFMPRPHRVLAELLHWAESAGAVARNRMELVSATPAERQNDGWPWRAVVRDLRGDERHEIATRRLINAAGADVDRLLRNVLGRRRPGVLAPTLAWGLLLDRSPLADCSVAVSAAGRHRRTWFVHPYHGRVLAGTGHAGVPPGEAPPSRLPDARVRDTLAELNEAMPGAGLTRAQVAHVFLGVLPGSRAGAEPLMKHPRVIDHGRSNGAPGLYTVLGVKFTEAPSVARGLWDRILGPRTGALPARPPPVDVPSIGQARAMPDEALVEALRRLAAVEWQADAADLAWRRTDLWMDREQAGRVAALMTGSHVDGRPRGILPTVD